MWNVRTGFTSKTGGALRLAVALTTAGLLLVPSYWHHRFGEWAIPLAIKYMKLYALGAFALGAFILYGVLVP